MTKQSVLPLEEVTRWCQCPGSIILERVVGKVVDAEVDKRKNDYVVHRQLLTLDVDFASEDFYIQLGEKLYLDTRLEKIAVQK